MVPTIVRIKLVTPVSLTDITDFFDSTNRPELTAIPGASVPPLDKLDLIYMFVRNKLTQNSTTQTLYADNGTTVVGTSTTTSGGGTTTRGEFA